MGKHFFDFEDGDFAFSISDNMAMDSDGDLMMRMGNNIAKLRREVKANSTGYGTPNGNFINVGCMMPYMDYTPRTLDEIIEGDARYHEENPDAL